MSQPCVRVTDNATHFGKARRKAFLPGKRDFKRTCRFVLIGSRFHVLLGHSVKRASRLNARL